MGKVPDEEFKRNCEFYKRWKKDNENVYDLIKEYNISYSRAYQIKVKVERKPQYKEFLTQFDTEVAS